MTKDELINELSKFVANFRASYEMDSSYGGTFNSYTWFREESARLLRLVEEVDDQDYLDDILYHGMDAELAVTPVEPLIVTVNNTTVTLGVGTNGSAEVTVNSNSQPVTMSIDGNRITVSHDDDEAIYF